MLDLNFKLPLELTRTLNEFNKELSELRKDIIADASSKIITYNNSKSEQITFSYKTKNSNLFFDINFIVSRDLIHWKFYPYNNTSTKPTTIGETNANDSKVYNQLLDSLKSWLKIVKTVLQLDNPLTFFEIDDFIKFYSNEILDEIPISDEENKFPLSSEGQKKAIDLINIQEKFLIIEIEEIEDKTSEKYHDLELSRKLIEKIKEELPRTTVADLKRNWAISLGSIKKWCSEKFIQYLIADKQTNYDLSRTLGSFIGGVLGIPKIEQ
ncbi:MAG: hypothetical protein AB7S72_13650 [Draconibacterium sp.]